MNLFDSFNYSLLKLRRNKKNLFFVIFISLCGILLLGILIFRFIYFYNLNMWSDNNIDFRRIVVAPTQEELDKNGLDYDYDFEKILNIEHVLEVYEMNYDIFDTITDDFKSNKYSGHIELLYGDEFTLPNVISGKNINSEDTGVAICSKNFYPSINKDELNKIGFIDGKKLLNTNFEIKEPLYARVDGKLELTDKYYVKKFKIVGIFDNLNTLNSANSCYISKKDMIELYDTTTRIIEQGFNSRLVIIDNRKNLGYVMKKIEEIGFRSKLQVYVDNDSINNIKLICNLLTSIVIVMLFFVTILYVKKKSIDDHYEMGLFKALGYSNKDIRKINLLMIFIYMIISFAIIIIIFDILYLLFLNFFNNFIVINNLYVKQNLFSYILVFLIIIILPTLINFYNTNKNLKCNISNLITEEN